MNRQPSQICSYANTHMRFVHPLCAYRSRVTQLKQFASALWKRVRACPRYRATQSNPAPMPMVSARCTPHFRSNNSRRVRKCFGAPAALPGHGASISVEQSIHRIPRRRSVSATCCELKNGITLGGNCDTATCTTGYWSGATSKDFNEASVFMVKALGLDQSPVKWCQAANP